jgi:hypothetical protein
MVREPDTVACLVLACGQDGYPLARHFIKSIEVADNALMLAMSGRALPSRMPASPFTVRHGSPRTR